MTNMADKDNAQVNKLHPLSIENLTSSVKVASSCHKSADKGELGRSPSPATHGEENPQISKSANTGHRPPGWRNSPVHGMVSPGSPEEANDRFNYEGTCEVKVAPSVITSDAKARYMYLHRQVMSEHSDSDGQTAFTRQYSNPQTVAKPGIHHNSTMEHSSAEFPREYVASSVTSQTAGNTSGSTVPGSQDASTPHPAGRTPIVIIPCGPDSGLASPLDSGSQRETGFSDQLSDASGISLVSATDSGLTTPPPDHAMGMHTPDGRHWMNAVTSDSKHVKSRRTPDSDHVTERQTPDSHHVTSSVDPDTREKPAHSYIALISMALFSVPERKLVLSDIYQYAMDSFPYYNNHDRAWRNSIRHNLSLNECFIKAGRAENGKGNYWAIHPACVDDFARGDYRRRHARRRARGTGFGDMAYPVAGSYQDQPVGYMPLTSSPVMAYRQYAPPLPPLIHPAFPGYPMAGPLPFPVSPVRLPIASHATVPPFGLPTHAPVHPSGLPIHAVPGYVQTLQQLPTPTTDVNAGYVPAIMTSPYQSTQSLLATSPVTSSTALPTLSRGMLSRVLPGRYHPYGPGMSGYL